MRTKFTFLLIGAMFCSSPFAKVNAQVDVQDSLALVDLYNSTNGPNWINNNNWLTGPVRTWYGN